MNETTEDAFESSERRRLAKLAESRELVRKAMDGPLPFDLGDLAAENRKRVADMLGHQPPYTETELLEATDAVLNHPRYPACRDILASFKSMPLFYACRTLLDHLEFFTWPAAISHHHNREGGLLEHALEVADIALHIAAKFPGVNFDVLIAAALWHDYGKLFEYVIEDWDTFDNVTERPSHLTINRDASEWKVWVRDRKAVHHCISSAQEFIVAARQHGVDRATEDAVVHCILSHHGPVKEWGSPVAPESLEAIILHQADYLSAKAGATK